VDCYLLNNTFGPESVIGGIMSVVWTERYYEPGDMSITLAATPANFAKYPLGAMVQRFGSKEVMIVDRRSFKGSQLVLTGKSLLNVLSKRSHFPGDESTDYEGNSDTYTQRSDEFAERIFQSVRETGDGGGNSNPDPESKFCIDNLTAGAIGSVGPMVPISMGAGQTLLELLVPVAKENKMGVSIYLDSISPPTYSLKYSAYFGNDLSDTIAFSEEDGDLINVEVIESNEFAAGIIFVYIPAFAGSYPWYLSMDGSGTVNTDAITNTLGLTQASVVVPMTDVTLADYIDDPTTLKLMEARARLELSTRKAFQLADGEITPAARYKYIDDYYLGDLVTLKTNLGIETTARITEYICISDGTGYREYPTIEIEE